MTAAPSRAQTRRRGRFAHAWYQGGNATRSAAAEVARQAEDPLAAAIEIEAMVLPTPQDQPYLVREIYTGRTYRTLTSGALDSDGTEMVACEDLEIGKVRILTRAEFNVRFVPEGGVAP